MPNIFNVATNKQLIENFKDFPRSDPHCHTYYSDGCWYLKDLVKSAKKKGFPVVMKADHNTTRGNYRLKKICDQNGLLCIPGIEISTNKGHLLGINVYEWDRNPGNLEEVMEKLHDMNAIGVLCHPWWGSSIREEVFTLKQLDGYEGLNGSNPFGNLILMKHLSKRKQFRKLNSFNLPAWAGSDSHAGYIYGQYHTIFHTTDVSVDGIMEAMHKGKITAFGPFLPIRSFLMDGAINQPIQLKKQLFYKKKKS
jgi:predicted metal-dependent phosphoesterase TrpH